jgi:nitroreductase
MSSNSEFNSIVNYRRSVRVYDANKLLDTEKVKNCIELSTLAPNSSNMQLWEFYHITDSQVLKQLSIACLNQNAAKTAQQMVVFVVRKDKWKLRAKQNFNFIDNQFKNLPKGKFENREKMAKNYYSKLIPTIYTDFFGIFGFFKMLFFNVLGIFRPMYREVSQSDIRVVAHKSTALAAQTFMLAMAAEKYDTCPMEGFDSKLVKKALNLPYASEINMIISCGIRDEAKGIYGERFRIPFEEVYNRL